MPGISDRKLAYIHELLAKPLAGPSKQWAHDLLNRQAAGVRLSPIQEQLARAAIGPRIERIPGEDDVPW